MDHDDIVIYMSRD